MDFPSDFNSFWHAQVIPGKPCKITVKPNSDCSISNIALHQNEDQTFPQGARTILYVSVNDGEPVAIAPFTVGQFESTCVDVRFTDTDNIVLTIKGAEIAIDVVGNALGDLPLIDNGVLTPQDEQ